MALLVGPNGCGKSTVLEVLRAAGADNSSLRQLARRGAVGWKAAVRTETEQALVWYESGKARENGSLGAGPTRLMLHLQASTLAQATSAPQAYQVGHRGENLASVLVNLRLEDEERFYAIERDFQQLVPFVEKLRATRKGGDQVLVDFIGADRIPASDISQGTLILLGILTALHTREAPDLLLLDDIEHGLHPTAQHELIALLRKLQESRPRLQIVASSHSPYLVDAFTPEEVIVFALRKDGTTACKRLSEHPDVERAMQVLSTGEFLTAEGESWVLDG